MAKQLNLLSTGQIIPTALHVEMERSYLEYAMSVIIGRALPDVRDGLKPVHRRILYAMHELGLTPDRPYRKCARVVGDVLGKYHPHGDQSVYDALVRMVQNFSSRYPLLDGHGNFGSVDNDPPAAMRYTETRLAPIADTAMLSEIGEATVNFIDNFDSSQQEPVVLPTQLPILLLNGCSGIAVGMATNIPPHNLAEVVDGLIALIDKPELPEEKLWQLIPGPDFPTGGEIVELQGIRDAYQTGRGIIKVRGVAKVERISVSKKRRKQRTAIVITELPYQVNKAGWIEKVADLVNQARLEGIADIRDESDRDGLRVVIELKKDTQPQAVLQQLYRQTALQSNFGAIMLALVNNKPCQLPLRRLLQEFLQFREETLIKQYSHELEQTQQRLHLVAGLLVALNNLDRVIDILRHAADGTTAKHRLTAELHISDAQADSILAMPMRRLTGLERQKLETESRDLQERITQLEQLLGDRHELMKALKKELRALKRKFGDERRTKIINTVAANQQGNIIKSTAAKESKIRQGVSDAKIERKNSIKAKNSSKKVQAQPIQSSVFNSERSPDARVKITANGCIYWQNPPMAPKSASSPLNKGEDFVIHSEAIGKQEHLIVITDSGKAYPVAVEDIPPVETIAQTTTLSLLSKTTQRDASRTVAHFFLPEQNTNLDLVLLTEKGIIKRLKATELDSLGNRGLVLIKLKEQDRLRYVCFAHEDEQIAIATTGGRILRFPINDRQIPIMGRNARGNQASRLRYGEELAGCVICSSSHRLLLVSQLGYGKSLPLSDLRLANRGDIGTQAMHFTSKEDNLAVMTLAKTKAEAILTTDTAKRLILPVDSVPVEDKNSIGEKIVKLRGEEKIVDIYLKP
ncbi:MAG: DNA topoisomerase 4 subunit A [Xenococcaceae cyanobacterium MO_188.B32]|nr:DNA topoisomerase 4 subunit A [Xenococcaceae cyanobacterium MO_188.B32]